jgi:hypothetical protein
MLLLSCHHFLDLVDLEEREEAVSKSEEPFPGCSTFLFFFGPVVDVVRPPLTATFPFPIVKIPSPSELPVTDTFETPPMAKNHITIDGIFHYTGGAFVLLSM